MPFEDITLTCVECNEAFVFTAGEQEFFAQKQLNAPPKRCSACRRLKRAQKPSGRRQPPGEYRSPAFRDSEPRGPRGGRRSNDYRSPAFRESDAIKPDEEYRSPAFRETESMDNAEEYRSPAFREYDHIKPEEEYRSPAFREYDHIHPDAEYRSPAFPGQQRRGFRKTERPLFQITCVACGNQAMVPFVPEEKDDPMCQDCYREHREMLRREQESANAGPDKPAGND